MRRKYAARSGSGCPADRELARSRRVKPEAYEAYLKGRYFWYRFTPEALHKSIFYLNQAVEIDPAYVAAYAALADTYSLLPQLELEPPGEFLDKCKSAAEPGHHTPLDGGA
ncbi:MAG: hypothetical protein HY820_28705 [Acidobacteria bacterium]|nr:hypothetical protein [Acidobacteriota bacterium]